MACADIELMSRETNVLANVDFMRFDSEFTAGLVDTGETDCNRLLQVKFSGEENNGCVKPNSSDSLESAKQCHE